MDEPEYLELEPPAELAAYVDACWFYRRDFTEPSGDMLIPEGVVDVMFNFGEPYFRQGVMDSEGAWVDGDVVVGQRTHVFLVQWPRKTRLFAIRLKPETAYLFFSTPMHEITNLTKPLNETQFLALADAVHAFSFADSQGIADLCFRFLADEISRSAKPDSRLSLMIREIDRLQGGADIQTVCDQLGLNRRTIERLFTKKVGLSPKFFARTMRLHHFLCLHRERSGDNLAHAAVDAQYYDQSHFIKEFKAFTGESPATFFNAPPGIYEPLLVSLIARRGIGGR